MNDNIKKIINNKYFMFIIPNLVYMYMLLNYYNVNFLGFGEVLFSEVIFLSLIFLCLTSLIYIFLCKCLKDKHKVFCMHTFICFLYFVRLPVTYLLGLIVFLLIMILCFKKFVVFKLDYIVTLVIFIIVFLFTYNLVIAGNNLLYMVFKSREYDNDINIKVQDDKDAPNIYWIHCDGMVGIGAMEEYFNFKNSYLKNYLDSNGFYLNENASLVAGHTTPTSLVALFNPYYYDNFFKGYLYDLEDVYLKKKKRTDFLVNFYELEDKRLNNELFRALKKKKYTTIGIADFNSYTGFYTDYFYDFYHFGYYMRQLGNENNELKLLKDNSRNELLAYIRFNHIKSITGKTLFYNITDKANFLDYEIVDYSNFDTTNYYFINDATKRSGFWLTQSMLKSLDEVNKINNEKFVFLDFKLSHDPFTFDSYGNIIGEDIKLNVDSYLGNYTYSTYLLRDLLSYIKNNDEDAVIIVQADHGLHTIDDNIMLEYFDTDIKGVQDIRNSVISAFYIPDKYKNGDEDYLNNPLNISRYIVNNYVGKNYEYIS